MDKKKLKIIFKYKNLKCFIKTCFFVFFISFSFKSFSASHFSERELETDLKIFEKAVLLSPDFLDKAKDNSVIPFYKIKGHKIYLDEGIWNLTRAWIRLYIEEIDKYCPCDLDPDLMIQEAKNYLPQGFFKQKIFNSGQRIGREISHQGAHLTARYGYTAATLKLSAELAETILSFTVGGKGIHILCNTVDIMIFPLMRGIQKHIRVFSYGRGFGVSGLLSSAKMAWFSRQIKNSQKRVFFHIDQALSFREQELEKVNKEGPRSLFHKKGHRLLWIKHLKRKTDPLFEKITELELQLQNENLSLKKQTSIVKKIEKLKRKIENVSKVNRRDFFGKRFKRYLLLRTRRSRVAYTSGHSLQDKMAGKNILWPLSLQENVIERVLETDSYSKSVNINPDEIQDGLIEEFLFKKEEMRDFLKDETELNNRKRAIQFLLADIEQIFNVKIPKGERLMKAHVIEATLGTLFAHYLKVSTSILSQKYGMSFAETMKLHWIFGGFFNLVYEFSDFLSSVSITKNEKIQFYKYESIEKFLAFFDYLYEIQILLKEDNNSISKQAVFERLNSQKHNLKVISLLKEKKTAFSLLPFRKALPQCEKLVKRYQ